MPVVAIHQPNYLPWLGYFHKILKADVFVFLDDAQFPKGSYTNRTRIGPIGGPRWLTVPVSVRLGDPINAVSAVGDWRETHVRVLHAAYRSAERFAETWAWFEPMIRACPDGIASGNRFLIERIAERLGIKSRIEVASAHDVATTSTDRLIALANKFGPSPVYLSGKGGAKYQDETLFPANGITLEYTAFKPPAYAQWGGDFAPGLSVADALFHVGEKRTAEMVQ